MRRLIPLALGLGLLVAACADDVATPTALTAPRASVVRADAAGLAVGSYIVAFHGSEVPADFAAQVTALGGHVAWSHAGVGLASVSGVDPAAAAAVNRIPGVAEVDADPVVALDAPRAPRLASADGGAASAADPTTAARYAWQWNMRLIHADHAWAAGRLGSSAVTVAILDTGIDYDAHDLAGLVDLSRSTSFIPSDDSITAAYFPARNVVSDYDGHGTNVANQVSSNAVFTAGVTSRTKLMAVKVLDAHGVGGLGAVLGGVLWAADHGANIANMSLGSGFAKAGNGIYSAIINRVFNYAGQRGMLIVVAAGNEALDADHDRNLNLTFCATPRVVCVSAVGPTAPAGSADEFATYSNYGRSVISVAAPGGNISAVQSAWPWGADNISWVWGDCSKTWLLFDSDGNPTAAPCISGNYVLGYVGTSQATPHVTGLAALLAAEGITDPAQLKAAILKATQDLGQPGTDPYYGRGRIDIAKALGL